MSERYLRKINCNLGGRTGLHGGGGVENGNSAPLQAHQKFCYY